MKLPIACFVFVLSSISLAGPVTVQDPCGSELWVKENVSVLATSNAGKVTISALESADIDFVGSEQGIASIGGTPFGDEALEVISDSEMRSYGWCFEVNGVQPATFADKVSVKDSDSIHWFYGYAHYDSGEWLNYCIPTHISKPSYICASQS